MVLVSITRLRLRSWRFLPMFAWYVLRSARQAARAEGNLAAKLLRERRNTFWTSTIWTGEAAMKKFMTSGAHGKAMRKLAKWCDEAAGVHWTQESPQPPSRLEADQRLQKDGSPSQGTHPLTRPHPYHIFVPFVQPPE